MTMAQKSFQEHIKDRDLESRTIQSMDYTIKSAFNKIDIAINDLDGPRNYQTNN